MSLFDRRFVLILPLALAACGFSPVHAPQGTGAAIYGQIEVQEPSNEDGYRFVRNLEQRLGRTSSGAFKLTFALDVSEEGQAITTSGDITRFSITGVVDYTLTRQSDSVVVASGKAQNFTGYSAQGSTVDLLAGERNAHERLMVILADQVTTDLLATTDLSSGNDT